jgi:hypothetical protein
MQHTLSEMKFLCWESHLTVGQNILLPCSLHANILSTEVIFSSYSVFISRKQETSIGDLLVQIQP